MKSDFADPSQLSSLIIYVAKFEKRIVFSQNKTRKIRSSLLIVISQKGIQLFSYNVPQNSIKEIDAAT
ncbi:hypothetical protein NADFUDRAFT_84522 [Nadsonia fulvescens var. elongata DSM 6958]|uniref:Uncharacterized protein n=1 Tax=Nadsonia fulvescens var. elongata DSM 6958 TaxID=857566 RepID=A0A1E3PDE9_9ASCO|nr:hypothetical protein NADFUDRAFT_84522 [Nadsonia fulvescens var. elongata DSM 6958]